MRAATAAVAVLVVLSGCNALGGAGGGRSGAETRTVVTPAPVPTAAATPDGTPRPSDCVAPRPAVPDRTPTTPPATPRPLPRTNGTVDGSALVALHHRTLLNHSYRLESGATVDVWAMPNRSAFAFSGLSRGIYRTNALAVGGHLYVHVRSQNGTAFVTDRPYRAEEVVGTWLVPSLTGRPLLRSVVGPYDWRVVGTRPWNGTTVRVLRPTLETPAVIGRKRITLLNSTVLVDTRGIIRQVEHYERYRVAFDFANKTRSRSESFSVRRLDDVRIPRPRAFCGVDAARRGLPSDSLLEPVVTTASTPANASD